MILLKDVHMCRFVLCGEGKDGRVRVYDKKDGYCEEEFPEVLKASGVPIKVDYSYGYAKTIYDSVMSGWLSYNWDIDDLSNTLMGLHDKFGHGLSRDIEYDYRTIEIDFNGAIGLFFLKFNKSSVSVTVVNISPNIISQACFEINDVYTLVDFRSNILSIQEYKVDIDTRDIIIGFWSNMFGVSYKFKFDKYGKQLEV